MRPGFVMSFSTFDKVVGTGALTVLHMKVENNPVYINLQVFLVHRPGSHFYFWYLEECIPGSRGKYAQIHKMYELYL